MQKLDKQKRLLVGVVGVLILGIVIIISVYSLRKLLYANFQRYSSYENVSAIRQNIQRQMHLGSSSLPGTQQLSHEQYRASPIKITEGIGIPLIQTKAIQEQLKKMVMENNNRVLSVQAMSRLIIAGDYPKIRKVLANDLSSSTWQISLNAAEGLAKAGDYSGFNTVKAVLEKGEWSAKIEAAKTMGLFGDKGRAVLEKEINSPDRWIRLGVQAGLARLGDKQAADALEDGLNNFDTAVQVYCAKSLAEIGDQRAKPYLEKLFASNDPYIKAEGAKYLYLLGDKQAKNYLMNMLQDVDPYWQNYAIMALTQTR